MTPQDLTDVNTAKQGKQNYCSKHFALVVTKLQWGDINSERAFLSLFDCIFTRFLMKNSYCTKIEELSCKNYGAELFKGEFAPVCNNWQTCPAVIMQ